MRTINIRDAKKQLSGLVKCAAQGESFIIAKAGKPMVKLIPFSQENISTANRLGFMQGEFTVPAVFDQMGSKKIARSFKAAAISTCGYRFNRDAANERV